MNNLGHNATRSTRSSGRLAMPRPPRLTGVLFGILTLLHRRAGKAKQPMWPFLAVSWPFRVMFSGNPRHPTPSRPLRTIAALLFVVLLRQVYECGLTPLYP